MSNELGLVVFTVWSDFDSFTTYLTNSPKVVGFLAYDGTSSAEVTTWNHTATARLVQNLARHGYEFDVDGVDTKAVGV